MHILYVPHRARDDYLINALGEAGHVVEAAADHGDGVFMMSGGEYDLIVLDQPTPTARPLKRIVEGARGALLVLTVDASTPAERLTARR